MNMKQYETAKKTIMELIRITDIASRQADTLESKITYQRMLKDMQAADLIMKKHYYTIEDAIKIYKEAKFCDECGSQL